MIRLSARIQLGDYLFDFVNTVQVVSSWENLTSTARIVMPRKLVLKKNGVSTEIITVGVDALWKRGDRVTIDLGYDGLLDNRFEGFITGINPKFPPEFVCEDMMWQLKQVDVPKYTKTVTIRKLMSDILPEGIKFVADDISLGKFRATRVTIAEVLDYIKRTYGLSAYFKKGTLYVGFAYQLGRTTEVDENTLSVFEFYKNIIDGDDLTYQREDDIKLFVTAVNIFPNNERQEIKVGDPFGDQRTMYFYNLPQESVEKLANEALHKLKYEGFRGSFTTFGQPEVNHGDAIKLVDNTIPDRNGTYLVRQVVVDYGEQGFRQTITLDRKI